MAMYLGSNEVAVTKITEVQPTVSDAVRFFDYDGTLLHSYSVDEFLALSALPANPSHTGLTAQGWNWTLSDAQSYVEDWGYLDIGQSYVTSSGKTEIDIKLIARLDIYLSLAVNGTVSIDWGDNSTASTATGSSYTTVVYTQHTYATGGTYTIKISISSGGYALIGTSTRPLVGGPGSTMNSNRVYSAAVKAVRLGSDDVRLSSYAFAYCSCLRYVTIPTSITFTSSATYIFQYCQNLDYIVLPKKSSTYTLSNYFCYYAYNLTGISISNSVTGLGSYPFSYCYSLASLILPSTYNSTSDMFQNMNAPNRLERYINPAQKIKLIINKDFNISSALQDKTSIAANQFAYNNYITNVTVPNTFTSISSNAFSYCYSLTTVTIPSSITSLTSGSIFSYCTSLKTVTISANITSIGALFSGCVSLRSVTFPNTVTLFSANMFMSCSSLTEVTLPPSLTTLPTYTFYQCFILPEISIPNTVTELGNYVFNTNRCLSTITIPSGVTSIGNYAFADCTGMKEYHIKPTSPPTLGTSAFSNIPSDCIMYVPSASLDTYKSASNWSTYASYMVGE